MEHIPFLNRQRAVQAREQFGTPCYLYDEATLRENAAKILAFPNAFGMTARFAMKACPNGHILRLFHSLGLWIDASSGYEAQRAILAGVPAEQISLSTQQFPDDGMLRELVEQGMRVNACSLQQIRRYGRLFPGTEIGVRFNPGLGSGGTQRTNVGGPASSFGIWHEQTGAVQEAVDEHGLSLIRIHSHIGSGGDPDVWLRVVSLNLNLVRRFPSVHTLNLGGGYKVGRMPHETTTDLQAIGEPMKQEFEAFAAETGREIRLEVGPGTYAVANAGVLLATIQDVASTGTDGYEFLKLDTGMTELLRPSLYGAQHPMEVYPVEESTKAERDYLVVGHCCESGDILTPQPGDPEGLAPRRLSEAAIGDLLAIGGCGAYCAAMPAKNYNSFPEAPEAVIRPDGSLQLIRRRQTLEQMIVNEL